MERGAEAIEETAAVAAEEGKVAVAAEGVGGAFGYLGGLAEGAGSGRPAPPRALLLLRPQGPLPPERRRPRCADGP